MGDGRSVNYPLASYWGRSVDDGSGIRIPELQPATQGQNKGRDFNSLLVNYFGRRVDGSDIKTPRIRTGNSRVGEEIPAWDYGGDEGRS